MRKGNLLNADILEVIAKMGHTDEIVIADAGLPIPPECKRIDIALTFGVPSFMEVLRALLEEYKCQEYFLAEEIIENNVDIHDAIISEMGQAQVHYVSHEEFKKRTKQAKAVIRTGECTPYANIILRSDVIF